VQFLFTGYLWNNNEFVAIVKIFKIINFVKVVKIFIITEKVNTIKIV
jgi:hypothetical protein